MANNSNNQEKDIISRPEFQELLEIVRSRRGNESADIEELIQTRGPEMETLLGKLSSTQTRASENSDKQIPQTSSHPETDE